MVWKAYRFEELTAAQLYDMLKLRVDVFVVEQNCPYPELDGVDHQCVHLACIEEGQILAYARLVPAGVKYKVPAIGRVIVQEKTRGTGLGKELIKRSISFITEEWNEQEIQLQAQEYLKNFYGSFGFQPISDVYDEDGIPHIDMKLMKQQQV